jgi:HPt (histidine-containing phosphotransfer) domain-containing protein
MLDWSRVEELKADLGEEDFQEITELFLEEVEERLAELPDRNGSDMAGDLHFLKGSAANLGFESFRALCEQLERSADPSRVSELLAVYQDSKSTFLAGLGA